ncbi:MAG: hypothetical protein WC802_04310 [Patescibacteria group bacterium]|jgi:hypothetical protein
MSNKKMPAGKKPSKNGTPSRMLARMFRVDARNFWKDVRSFGNPELTTMVTRSFTGMRITILPGGDLKFSNNHKTQDGKFARSTVVKKLNGVKKNFSDKKRALIADALQIAGRTHAPTATPTAGYTPPVVESTGAQPQA